jgi:hypothetical protein
MEARARRTDPVTSHEAAARAEQTIARAHRIMCLREVQINPGQTSAEIAESIGLDRYQVARRLPELADCDPPQIMRGRSRTCSVKGTRAITWEPAGRMQQSTLF